MIRLASIVFVSALAAAGPMFGRCVRDYRAPKDVMVTPGTGQVDFPKVFAHLPRGGFTRGPLIVNGLAPGDAAQQAAWTQACRVLLNAHETITRY